MSYNSFLIQHKQRRLFISGSLILVVLLFLFISWCISCGINSYSNTFLFYFTIISGASIFALLSQSVKEKEISHTLLFFSISILWLPFATRDLMGTDDNVYLNIFNKITTAGFLRTFLKSTMEPGYLLLNKISFLITDNYIFCRILCATLPFIIFYKTLIKLSRNIYFYIAILHIGCCLYFIILEAALVRMFIAISIVLYSFRFLINGQTKKYGYTILIAMLFHYSAGVMLLFSILTIKDHYYAKSPVKISILLTLIFVIMFGFVSFMASNILGERYLIYSVQDDSDMTSGFNIMKLDTLPFVIWGIIFHKHIPSSKITSYNIFLIILLMSSVVSIMSSFMPLGRLIFYFNCSIIFLVSYWYRYSTGIIKSSTIFIYTLYCFLYAYVTKLSIFDNNLYPYKGLIINILN